MAKPARRKSDYIILPLVGLAVFLLIWRLYPSVRPQGEMQWVEGSAFADSIAAAIRGYARRQGPEGKLPKDNDFVALGLTSDDLDGKYFNQSVDGMFSFAVTGLNPLKFTVTVVNPNLNPFRATLDQDGTVKETYMITISE